MWFTPDGRVNVAVLPSEDPAVAKLRRLLSDRPQDERQLLNDEFENLQWTVAKALDGLTFDAVVEAQFVALPPPNDVLETLDWARLIGPEKESELSGVGLRWRLDVVGVVQQAIADLDPQGQT